MDNFRPRSLGDFEVFVDVIEIDEHAHRRSAGVEGRVHAALVCALSHHHELTLKRGLPVHAPARRAHPHFLLEAKGASEKIKRGANVAIEELGDDLRRFRGDRHGFSLPSPFSLGEKGRG
jgi:hypothetical protein